VASCDESAAERPVARDERWPGFGKLWMLDKARDVRCTGEAFAPDDR